MKIVVNKAVPKEIEYKAGDVISLGNPYEQSHFLLVQDDNGSSRGYVNLSNGIFTYIYNIVGNFDEVVKIILKGNEWDEWALIKSEDVTMTLNCKDGAMEQRNNSGLF